MLECCILFLHHHTDATTRAHLNLLRRMNPDPVVALVDGAEDRLAGSFDAGRPEWGATGSTWFHVDTAIYRWFRHGGIKAKRYVFLEYDAHASMSVREAYASVWDADAAASRLERVEEGSDWCWFQAIPTIPPHLRTHAAGLAPMNGILLSHRALAMLAAIPPNRLPDCHCELRIATLLRAGGFELTALPSPFRATNEWHPSLIHFDPDRPGIYHPVKHFATEVA